jgi:hypothetical protein
MNIDPVAVHRLKNKLAIILGFCELLLQDSDAGDQRTADLLQIQDAARSALEELPPLPAHEFASTLNKPEAANGD